VDFLVCDQAMHIKAVLELDDNSHNQKDRKDRDAFVDQILTSVGYKVIRTHSITETTLDSINTSDSKPAPTQEET
jgi:very-short-patch-repair endonuclease